MRIALNPLTEHNRHHVPPVLTGGDKIKRTCHRRLPLQSDRPHIKKIDGVIRLPRTRLHLVIVAAMTPVNMVCSLSPLNTLSRGCTHHRNIIYHRSCPEHRDSRHNRHPQNPPPYQGPSRATPLLFSKHQPPRHRRSRRHNSGRNRDDPSRRRRRRNDALGGNQHNRSRSRWRFRFLSASASHAITITIAMKTHHRIIRQLVTPNSNLIFAHVLSEVLTTLPRTLF
jgi:hypothetical protein